MTETTASKSFPQPWPLRKMIGPSFVILALGLGSGEIILWPYLASNYGLGIAWGAVLGITFQFFMNMEIERYALVRGESVFVGINRLWRGAAYWFILSTFIGFGLPGIIAASAQVFSHALGWSEFKWTAIIFLILIGVILSAGKTVYGMMEKITRTVILVGAPSVFLLAVWLAARSDWAALAGGLVGEGDGFWFLPAGVSLATFLGAFAYAGAGGNLNLTQSIYVKEKGYGMGAYAQKIAGLFAAGEAKQKIKLTGEKFEETPCNMANYRAWWRRVNWEHLMVFWFIGSLSMIFLMLLAYATTHGVHDNAQGINFVLTESVAIGGRLGAGFGTAFLVLVAVMLFQTQLGVMDSTSRIMAENYALKKLRGESEGEVNLSRVYYTFVWAQIAFGILLFLFNIYEPKTLIVLGAVINAFAMFVHTGLVFVINHKILPRAFRPGLVRKIIISVIFAFFGFFSALVFWDKFFA